MGKENLTAQEHPVSGSDIVFVARGKHAPSVLGLQGRYEFANWRDANGNRRSFPCRIRKMSSGIVEVSGSIKGSTGEWVVATFEALGKFEGPIVRVDERGFAMRIVTTLDGRKNIDGKIAWIENKSTENRRHERLIPPDPRSILYLPSGHNVDCQIINYSMSGAAVAADTATPEIGTIVIVGKIPGLVMREFAEGFAIQFLSIRNLGDIEELFSENGPLLSA